MSAIKINISELKNIISRINLAVEKAKLNPKSGWIELETVSEYAMSVKVASYDYYLYSNITISCEGLTNENSIHATVTADTFIPLVSKLDEDYVEMFERMNSLVLTTKDNEYTFPIIKENGVVRTIDEIPFNTTRCTRVTMSGSDIASVAESNAKGLLDSIFSSDIQQFIYVDNLGALTYTENIYINSFKKPSEDRFKFLVNGTQSKLLEVFGAYDDVEIAIEEQTNFEGNNKIMITSKPNDDLKLVIVTQSSALTEKFPSIKIRQLASAVSETHAIIDKKTLDKALARLMVFDKKFDKTVLNYSKFVFGKDSVKLVSIKNKNFEVVPYVSGTNCNEHEAMVRFADVVNQLKAINSKEIDISYGDSPALVLNTDTLKQLIPEIRATNVQ